MSNTVIIVLGGQLGDWVLRYISEKHTLIGADSGAAFLVQHGFNPDVAIGDFDSVSLEQIEHISKQSRQMISCDPIDKDYTDSEMAFRLALDMKPAEIIMLGATGTRFDHSLANIELLVLAHQAGVHASIIDANNRISLASGSTILKRSSYKHVSLLPLSSKVTGVTLTGFKYPLTKATLTMGQSIGVSNILLAEEGKVEHSSGKLLIIESKDE